MNNVLHNIEDNEGSCATMDIWEIKLPIGIKCPPPSL